MSHTSSNKYYVEVMGFIGKNLPQLANTNPGLARFRRTIMKISKIIDP